MGRRKKPPHMRAGHRSRDELMMLHAPPPAPVEQPPLEPIGVAPSTMTDDGRKVWLAAAPELERLKLLTRADRLSFQRYCEWFGRYLKLDRSVRRVRVVKSKATGMQRVDRNFETLLKIDDKLMTYERQFGMTPA